MMAVDGRLDFIEKEMCVLLGSHTTFRSFGALAYSDFYRKRIETRIAELQESSEKKKIEVWSF